MKENLCTLGHLPSDIQRVAVGDDGGGARFVDVPRCYCAALSIRTRLDSESLRDQVTLAFDRRGLKRVEHGALTIPPL